MIGTSGLRFHHFGLAAREPDRALAFLSAMDYSCGESVWDPVQGVTLNWCEKPDAPAVEVVSPSESGEGPLASVLAAQGTSFYHLCYEIDVALDRMLSQMASRGMRLVTVRPPLPAVLFGGRKVSFHVARGFGLIEILESPSDTKEMPRGG